MSTIFADVLAVEVTMRGVDRVTRDLDKLKASFGDLETELEWVKGALVTLGTVASVTFAGINAAADDWDVMTELASFSGSMQAAESVMGLIESLGRDGVFPTDEIESVAKLMERAMPGAFAKNIDLVKELGVQMGSLTQAATLVSKLEQGYSGALSRSLVGAGLIDKLRQQGVQIGSSGDIESSPQEILAALERITAQTALYEEKMKGVNEAWRGTRHSINEALESIGKPFLGAVAGTLRLVQNLVEGFTKLNNATGGWLSNMIIIGTTVNSLSKVYDLLVKMSVIEKLIAYWAGIRVYLQSGSATMMAIATIVDWMRKLVVIEKALVALQSIKTALAIAWAYATGNWVGAITATAIVGGIGYGAYRAMSGGGEGGSGNRSKGADDPARKPQRRDDWENVYKQMYGRAWTG